MFGHRLIGIFPACLGDIAQGRGHLDRAIALYDPAAHRALATRFGQDVQSAVLLIGRWRCGCLAIPSAALADAEHALEDAREIGQPPR